MSIVATSDPTFPLFPIFAFLGFILCLVPLPWHLQAWNSGTCAFMIWTATLCLVEFVNSIIWRNNVLNVAPIWCDISTQIILGAGIGIPASTLCITRRLYTITAIKTASITRDEKRRAILVDLLIAVGLPVSVLIMHIPVHAHRFDILEGIGCYPVTYNTLAAYFLYLMWPVVIGSVSFVYSCLTLRSFWLRRAQFAQLVTSSHSALSTGRYFRLMLLALMDMMCTVPLGCYIMYATAHGLPLAPWISWEDTHFNFARVRQIPAYLWRSNNEFQTGVEVTRWLAVFCALVFFALFGFASEARKHYRLAFLWVTKKLGIKLPEAKKSKKLILPSFIALPKTGSSSMPEFNRASTSTCTPSTPTAPPAYTPRLDTVLDISKEKVPIDEKIIDTKSLENESDTVHDSNNDLAVPPTAASSDSFSFRPSRSWVSFTDISIYTTRTRDSLASHLSRSSVASSSRHSQLVPENAEALEEWDIERQQPREGSEGGHRISRICDHCPQAV